MSIPEEVLAVMDRPINQDWIREECGGKKIELIKDLREAIPGLGLKEAKDFVERCGSFEAYKEYKGSFTRTLPQDVNEAHIMIMQLQRSLESAQAQVDFERNGRRADQIRLSTWQQMCTSNERRVAELEGQVADLNHRNHQLKTKMDRLFEFMTKRQLMRWLAQEGIEL